MDRETPPKDDLSDAGPHREQRQAGQDLRDPLLDAEGEEPGFGSDIRPGLPGGMDTPPKDWPKDDLKHDEPFPAFDPGKL